MLNMCVKSELDIIGNTLLSRRKYLAGRKGGWMGGWMEAKAGLRIAYSNQKHNECTWSGVRLHPKLVPTSLANYYKIKKGTLCHKINTQTF